MTTADSFETDVTAFMPQLRRVALSICRDDTQADDLVQETVLKAIENKHTFQIGTNLQAWLTQICRNHFLSGIRKKSRMVDDPDGLILAMAEDGYDIAERLEASQALDMLGDLSVDHRNVMLDMANGLTMEEAAEKHGVPVGTIKSRVHRGRAEFSELVEIGRNYSSRLLPSAPKEARSIRAISLPPKLEPAPVGEFPPAMRMVAPSKLLVEPIYQRDISEKSLKLICRIVAGWNWTKFKPPICAETDAGLLVIDGQHTAIAAASHPSIRVIPVVVVIAKDIETRAEAFVAHNRDRLIMTPAQVFYGDVAAGDKEAKAVLDAVESVGGEIPRLPVPRRYAKQGQVTAVGEIRKIAKVMGVDVVKRIVSIAMRAEMAPINMTIIGGLRFIFEDETLSDVARMSIKRIATALVSIGNVEAEAQRYAGLKEISRYRACALLIANAARGRLVAAA